MKHIANLNYQINDFHYMHILMIIIKILKKQEYTLKMINSFKNKI